ncbi:MAG: hypothetical protein AMXMBFR84_00870 [Candidatus Hydrogenedentota bacterium]
MDFIQSNLAGWALIGKGMIVATVALLVSVPLYRSSAAKRHAVLLCAVVALVVLPILSFNDAWLEVPLPATAPDWSVAVPLESVAPLSTLSEATAQDVTATANVAIAQGTPWDARWFVHFVPNATLWLFAIGTLALLARLLVATARLRRWRIDAAPAPEHIAEVGRAEAQRMGMRRNVCILLSRSASTPMTWGTWRPVILLPATAETWTDEMMLAVVQHELAHIRRNDFLSQWFAALACAIHWPNPFVWYVAHRMRVERERACDDTVLRLGATPSAYAEHLVRAARESNPVVYGVVAVGMAHTTRLESRIRYLLQTTRSRSSISLRTKLVMVFAAVAVSLCVSGLGVRRTLPVVAEAEAVPFVSGTPPLDRTSDAIPLPSSFTIDIPSVGLIELVGVREPESNVWRSANGDIVVLPPGLDPGNSMSDQSDPNPMRYVLFRHHLVDRDVQVYTSFAEEGGDTSGSRSLLEGSNTLREVICKPTSNSLAAIDLYLAVTVGPWKQQGNETMANGYTTTGMDGYEIVTTPVRDSEYGLEFNIMTNRMDQPFADRVCIIDKSGDRHEGKIIDRLTSGDWMHYMTARVDGLKASDAKYIEYYMRPYQWRIISNVPLKKEAAGSVSVSGPYTYGDISAIRDGRKRRSDRTQYD